MNAKDELVCVMPVCDYWHITVDNGDYWASQVSFVVFTRRARSIEAAAYDWDGCCMTECESISNHVAVVRANSAADALVEYYKQSQSDMRRPQSSSATTSSAG